MNDKAAPLNAPNMPLASGLDMLTQHSMALAEALPQIVWTANADGWLDFYNQRWVDYTGMTTEQTQGWGWEPVLHPDDQQHCVDVWKKAVETGTPYEIEYRFKRASDGSYRWHLGRALPVRDAAGNIIKWFGTCTDIQDQKEAYVLVEGKIQQRTTELATANTNLLREIEERKRIAAKQQLDAIRLNEIITTQYLLAGAKLDLEAFFGLVVNRMDLLTPAAGSVVEIAEGDEIVYRAATGVAAGYVGLRLNLHASLSGLCVKSQEVLRCEDTENDTRVDLAACQRLNIRSMVVAPLFYEGKAVGVLKAMGSVPHAFAESDVQTLQLLAGLTGAAIGHQTAFEAKQKLLTELSAAVEATKANEQRTRTIIESSYDAFIAIDADGRIADWNQQAEATFGWTREETIGQRIHELIIPERFRAAHLAGMQHFHDTGEGPVLNRRIELQGLRRNGEEFPLELTINAIRSNEKYEFCAFLHDITERKKAEEELLHKAQYDQLTGLPNRTLFNDRVAHAMERAKRSKKLMALIYLDIDYFKNVNDTSGHSVGDAVLKEFAARLTASVRASDTVARLGGDEFVVLMEELRGPADSAIITEKIMRNVRSEAHLDAHVMNITTSLGGAFYRGEEMTVAELISRADAFLYQAKKAGRNTACWESPVPGGIPSIIEG